MILQLCNNIPPSVRLLADGLCRDDHDHDNNDHDNDMTASFVYGGEFHLVVTHLVGVTADVIRIIRLGFWRCSGVEMGFTGRYPSSGTGGTVKRGSVGRWCL